MKKTSYKDAGVDIDAADKTKKGMAESLNTGDKRVLNTMGAFASLTTGTFEGFSDPVLVTKTEEPGSKQILAIAEGRYESISQDLIHHLINDVIMMGAHPMFIQDLIVCGKMEEEVIKRLVKAIAAACKAHDAVLTGGETSEQPNVLKPGTYVLGASCIGVVERKNIVDGSKIQEGDTVLALESSGPHTNGYTLIRALLEQNPALATKDVAGQSFLDAILEPHRCYYHALKGVFTHSGLHGMAHITGGGIPGNLNRILPKNLDAVIDAASIKILPIFSEIKKASNNDDADMIKTFNLGVGVTIVVKMERVDEIVALIKTAGVKAYPIGTIAKGSGNVQMQGNLDWK
ncbi:MAG: phosphoribosylformylglycinamidine cyclo-ligase [Candidatus Peribacteraceae bacterium]